MKKYFNFLMMALIAIVTCVSLSSCSKNEEDPNDGWADYYLQLYGVETNLMDEDGNTIGRALMDAWKDDHNADSEYRINVGHCDKNTVQAWFDQTIQADVDAYREALCGKLDEGVVIYFYLRLGYYDEAFGAAWDDVVIKVTNDDVTIER